MTRAGRCKDTSLKFSKYSDIPPNFRLSVRAPRRRFDRLLVRQGLSSSRLKAGRLVQGQPKPAA